MIKIHQNGYSYSMDNFTRRLAAAILLLHIFIAVFHTVLVVGYGWGSRELKSLSHLLLLGINSPPSKTKRGSLITNKKIHSCTVVVQKMPESHFELVLDNERTSDDILL